MNQFLASERHFEHVLAIVLLLARLGDVGSAYLVTPALRFADPVTRRLGWRFAWLSVLVCVVPYYNTAWGVIAIVVSLFGTTSTLSRGWIVRSVGEDEYMRFLQRAAAASRLRVALAFVLASSGTFVLAGLVLIVLSGSPQTWPFLFAVGIIIHGLRLAIFGCAFMRRLYRVVPA